MKIKVLIQATTVVFLSMITLFFNKYEDLP